jgi:transcriptional regulator with XRE-family HTH domain
MPERSFGRTVRYRRTKLGLSQAKLGELVGRSGSTIRSWERDRSIPNDASVLFALAAVLGIDDRTLFDRAGTPLPDKDSSPTVEQALASLGPIGAATPDLTDDDDEELPSSTDAEPDAAEKSGEDREPEPALPAFPTSDPEPAGAMAVQSQPKPALVTPHDPFVFVTPTVPPAEPSYIEDQDQQQLYRIRYLATFVLLVALFVVLVWSFTSGLDAFHQWWDSFRGTLRL